MVDMRHAAAGNVLMLKMATSASQLLHNSYTFAAQPAAVGMSRNDSPRVAGTESQANGPARCSRCWTRQGRTPRGGVLAVERTRLETRRCWGTVAFIRPTQPRRTRKFTAGVIDLVGLPTEESHDFSRWRRSSIK